METMLDLIRRQLTRLFANWRTTLAGLVAIFSGLAVLARILLGEVDGDLLIPTISGIAAGFGLLFGQDAKPIEPPVVPPRGQ